MPCLFSSNGMILFYSFYYCGGNYLDLFRLPVLAGAAGALGATYCPPYISVDGSYHSRPSGQTSSVGSLRLVVWSSL